MQDLTVTLVQTKLYWENVQANLNELEEKLWTVNQQTDLIILPEMFNTGFSMDAQRLAEPMNLTTTKWMKQMAAQKKAVICGSFIVQERDNYFNRLLWVEPNGTIHQYDKRHLFRMAEEHKSFAAGDKKLITALKGWKICPLVCYDLRFPVWSRNTNNAYDLLLYVANWPAVRQSAWNTLLPARAVENLCYTIGVNRCGEDGKGIAYQGDSRVDGFYGNNLLQMGNQESISTILLSKGKLKRYREKFPAHKDADRFEVIE